MAQTATTEADKAADDVAELGKRTAHVGADAAREAIDRTGDAARRGLETARPTAGAAFEAERAVVRRSIEGAGEVGRTFAELVREQTRHNVAVLQALSRTVDWDGVAQVQGDFVRTSAERVAAFARCYLEVVQAVIASAASTAKEQAREVA